jgi:glycosyltransferase involved in cell wall biosynthesis
VRAGLSAALAARGWRVLPPSAARADVVHLHVGGRARASAAAAFRRLRARGARGVVTLQDLDHPDLPRDPAADAGLARLLRAADAATALTPALARAARRRFGLARVAVVGNGVGAFWSPAPGPRREAPLVVASARLAPYKGIDLLLLAFAELAQADPCARLLVLGRDFSRGHHARLARALGLGARVRFAGDAPPARVRAALRRARVFAFPSRRETWGMALVEALACGAPCLASRVGAAAGLRHRRDAWLAPAGDVRALARGLRRLWSDPALRRRLSAAGPRAAARHRWSLRAADYERVYRGRR